MANHPKPSQKQKSLNFLSELRNANDRQIAFLQADCAGIKIGQSFTTVAISSRHQKGYEEVVVREFRATKQNVDERCAEAARAIREFTQQMKRIYLRSVGAIREGRGEVAFQLHALSPIFSA